MTQAETRYGCFLPDLTGLARDLPTADFPLHYIRTARPMHKHRGLPAAAAALILLAALALLLPAAALASACDASSASLETAASADGEGLVRAELDGSSYHMIVDTGAPMGVVREGIAEALRLPRTPIPLDAATGGAGRPFEEQTIVEKLGLGALALKHVAFLVAPRTHAMNSGFDGLLGADILGRYDVELDYPDRRIRLYAPGACRPSGFSEIKAEFAPSGHIFAPMELDAKRVTGLIDTGAARTILTLGAAHRLFGLDPQDPGIVPAGEVRTADGGRIDAYFHRFASLRLGSLELTDLVVVLIPDETRRLHKVLPQSLDGTARRDDGLPEFTLGMTELNRLRLFIAYQRRQLFAAARENR